MTNLSPSEHNSVVAAIEAFKAEHGEIALNNFLRQLQIVSDVELSESSIAKLWSHLGALRGNNGGGLEAQLNEIAKKAFGKNSPEVKAFFEPDHTAASVAEAFDQMGTQYNARNKKLGEDETPEA